MGITTSIKNYPVGHQSGQGGGGGATYYYGSTGTNNSRVITTGTINATTGNIDDISGKTLNYNEGSFIYLTAKDGTISKLKGDDLSYLSGYIGALESDSINTGKITADEAEITKAWIENLNSRYITTEYLTVTKQAHFFELIIDKIRSVGGQIILTPANCIVDYAKAVDANGEYLDDLDDPDAVAYDIFWRTTDGSGRQITNDWIPLDQAICQSFNNVSAGVNYDVSNKYYWRLVKEILPDCYMNINNGHQLPLGSQAASINSVDIINPALIMTGAQGAEDIVVDTGFQTTAQTIEGITTGASWGQQTGGPGEQTYGTMTTTNTIFGIEIKPMGQQTSSMIIPDKFEVNCTPARLNIGFFYEDGTSQYFPAPEKAQTAYEYSLNANMPVEAITVSNADEVEWKTVHGIRLSNDYDNGECDAGVQGYASIPSSGDNLVQLGYRFDDPEATDTAARAAAIIIAAYKTPDNGYQTPSDPNYKAPLAPPSYAQYEQINDFNLGKHRKSYIDANGAAFIGNLYNGSGVSVEDMIGHQVSTPYYLHIAYANSADGQTDFTKVPVSGTSYSYMGFCSNSNPSDASLIYSDYEWSLVPGGTGTNGGHWEYAYCNHKPTGKHPKPSKPTAGTDVDHLPSGWTKTPSTPDFANGYFTFMSQCFVSGSTGAYGTWTDPVRITGDNGKDGEDGESLEFIYKHFTSQQTWTDNNLNPAYWAPNQKPDYTGPSGYQWSDNPQGVQADTMFEYMSQRKYDGHQWSKFTIPVIWSKWGENGKDGDGYEYIFKHFTGPQKWTTNYWNPAQWDASQDDEYLGPQVGGTDYRWNDDPQGISAGFQVEYVAMRKKTDGTWGKYNEPTIWAQWNEGVAGPQGAQGSAGPQGTGSIQYQLVSEGTQAGVKMGFDTNNNVTETLYLKPMFRVLKIENGHASYMTQQELQAKGLNGYILIDQSTSESTRNPLYYLLTRRTDVNYALLQLPAGSYTSTDETIIKYNAMSQVILINSSDSKLSPSSITGVIDAYSLPVGLFPEATFNTVQGTNASIKSLVTGYQSLNNELNGTNGIQNRLSLVEQTANGVQTTVAALTTTTSGGSNLIMNGAFKDNTKYWGNWGSSPTTREIYTDTSGKKWMHIISTTSRWEGYQQYLYGSQGITIEGGNNYSISLRARANSGTAKICAVFHYYNNNTDLYDENSINRRQRTIEWNIGASDKTYTATFEIPAVGYKSGTSISMPVNAFQIMVGDNTTSSQNFYITDITLVKGSIPAAWSPAPEETDAALNGLTTEVTRISVQANGIQSDVARDFQNLASGSVNLINGTQTLDSTYTNYYNAPTLSHGISSKGLYGVLAYGPTESYRDLIAYNGTKAITIKPNTEYVMSFWAKGTGTLLSYFYNGQQNMINMKYVNDEGSVGTSRDGGSTHTLTTDWKRHWVKYKTLETLPVTEIYMIFGRLTAPGSMAYVCGPKLEEGNIPGDWAPSVLDGHQFASSTIKQTADEILLKVGNCGIDIDNERIELNGDTQVNGKISMTDEYQGFILAGATKTTHISPKSIGTYSNFVSGTSIDTTQARQNLVEFPSNTTAAQTSSMYDSFGYVASGVTITISSQSFTFRGYNSGAILTPDSCSAVYRIYINGTPHKTQNVSGQYPTYFTWTTDAAGNISVQCEVTANFTRSNIAQYGYKVYYAMSYHINIPNQSYSLIGPDGIGLALGTGNIVYLGNSGAYFKYGNNVLRIDSSNGIQKSTNGGSSWTNL